MMDNATYLVSEAIAERSGMIDSRYRIRDGRFVLNDRDLSRVRFTTDEYISGLKGVERVDSDYARTLIAQNGFKMGRAKAGDEENAQNITYDVQPQENENNTNEITE